MGLFERFKALISDKQPEIQPPKQVLEHPLEYLEGASKGNSYGDNKVFALHMSGPLTDSERVQVCKAVLSELRECFQDAEFGILSVNPKGNFLFMKQTASTSLEDVLAVVNSPALTKLTLESEMASEVRSENFFLSAASLSVGALGGRESTVISFKSTAELNGNVREQLDSGPDIIKSALSLRDMQVEVYESRGTLEVLPHARHPELSNAEVFVELNRLIESAGRNSLLH